MHILVLSSPVTGALDETGAAGRAFLDAHPECQWRFVDSKDCTPADIRWADVITGHPNPAWLKDAPRLKWLHLQSAGVNGYERRELYASDSVLVTRAAGVHGLAIAEHAIAMALGLCRRLPELYVQQRNHRWQPVTAHYTLSGSRVLVLGAGYLADALVERLQGFGCRITCLRRDRSKPIPAGCQGVVTAAELPEALAEADFLFNTLPLTPATKGLLGEAAFRRMKPSLILVNVGRGGTMDHTALTAALQENRIAGAGLDVTDPEPLPPDSPLWDLPNVLITPHCSAWSDETDRRRGQVFLRQLDKFLRREPLDGQIDFSAGY